MRPDIALPLPVSVTARLSRRARGFPSLRGHPSWPQRRCGLASWVARPEWRPITAVISGVPGPGGANAEPQAGRPERGTQDRTFCVWRARKAH